MVRVRRVAGAAGVALIASLLAPVGLAAPAGATPGCVEETLTPNPVPILPPTDGCDDSTPPDTSLSASAVPNANGYLATSTVTFAIGAVVGDGDTGPFALECRLTGPAQAHDWRACASPVTYSGLPDAAAGSYTFSVRAVDIADQGRSPDANPLLPPVVADTLDFDQSPATMTWGQDTVAPFVFLTPDAYDEETPTQPVTGRDVLFRINSSERGSTFECTDNGDPVACSGGKWTLTDASSGRHQLAVRSIDKAGNASGWSIPAEFYVPTNLERKLAKRKRDRRAWRGKRRGGAFDGDVLVARKRGARLVLPRDTVGELRVYASTAPSHGKLRIRVGRRDWQVINLKGKRRASREFLVFDRFDGLRRGRIVIEVLSRNKPVMIDAIVARRNNYPAAHRSPRRRP